LNMGTMPFTVTPAMHGIDVCCISTVKGFRGWVEVRGRCDSKMK
jgi:hypothetical protein